jgi:hypothetical protein
MTGIPLSRLVSDGLGVVIERRQQEFRPIITEGRKQQ